MKKAKKTKKILWQIVGLVVLLALLVGASIVVTLMATGTIETPTIVVTYKPVEDVVDAEKICDTQIRFDYGDRVNSIILDERSGRFNKALGEYQLFYQLNVYRDETRKSGVENIYANCYIVAAGGYAPRLEYVDPGGEKSEVSRRDDTNIFGF